LCRRFVRGSDGVRASLRAKRSNLAPWVGPWIASSLRSSR
jgi:hypothetical protein